MKETNKLTNEELQKLRSVDFATIDGFVPAESILSEEIGVLGSAEREAFNAKARAWYYAEVLKQRRTELKITQKELAERVGKERTYISRVEKGETDIQLSSFIQLLDALGLTIRLEATMA